MLPKNKTKLFTGFVFHWREQKYLQNTPQKRWYSLEDSFLPWFLYPSPPSLALPLSFLILTWGYVHIFYRERKEEREKHWCERKTLINCLPYTPQPGINPQPKYVPWPGIKSQPFGVQDSTPTNWATWPGLEDFS